MTRTKTPIEKASEKEIYDLSAAIVRRAVDDWRALCKGKKETADRNFNELSNFFQTNCAIYVGSETAERIYSLLCRERKAAGL
jgi:hypothetical protein